MEDTQYFIVSQSKSEEIQGKYIETGEKHKLYKDAKKGDIIIHYQKNKSCITTISKISSKDNGIIYVEYQKSDIKINKKQMKEIWGDSDILFAKNYPFYYNKKETICIKQTGYLFKFTKEAYLKLIDFIKKTNIKQGESIMSANNKPNNKAITDIPLNQILYGPPGTGKTYNTVIKAMEIIDGKKYTDNNGNLLEGVEYDVLNKSFDDAKSNHQIEFITFHQSYSYEEFVEGIKPYIPKSIWEMDKDNINKEIKDLPNIKYIGQSGIFKVICENAKRIYYENNNEDNFDEVYEKFINDLKINHNDKDNMLKLKTSTRGSDYGILVNNKGNLNLYTGEDIKKQGSLTKENLKNLSDWYYYAKPIYDYLVINYNLNNKAETKPHILIIDEINRGNISKIFGELITLIEEDKREKVYDDGKKYNTLCVTLPYSQDTFSVPNNLYIIGTMNTADRSIANVDIALRRRFKFVEMMPHNDIVADFGCAFDKVFEKLNQRISALLDRDHQIGHSYFIKDKYTDADVNTLKDIWFDCVMPLLNEYFYGDWEKLQAILGKAEDAKGKSFIVSYKTNGLFATSDDENPCDGDYYDFREKSEYNNIENFKTAMHYAFTDFSYNKAAINDNKQDNQTEQTDNI